MAVLVIGGDPDMPMAVSDDFGSVMLALVLSLGYCVMGTALFFCVFVPLWVSLALCSRPSQVCWLYNTPAEGFNVTSLTHSFTHNELLRACIDFKPTNVPADVLTTTSPMRTDKASRRC